MVKCIKCKQEKSKSSINFSDNEMKKEQSICKKCFTCIHCYEEKTKEMYSSTEWQKEKSVCKSCEVKALCQKKHLDYNSEEKVFKIPDEKKCLNCSTVKPSFQFGKNQWEKKYSICKASEKELKQKKSKPCSKRSYFCASELEHSLCSSCFPKISAHEVKSLQINEDKEMTRCVECNEVKSNENFSYKLRGEESKICTHCKNYFTCIQCKQEVLISRRLPKLQLKRSRCTWRCKPCSQKPLKCQKKCLDSNTENPRTKFLNSEQKKTCIRCNEEKTKNMYSNKEWQKKKSTCKPCKERAISCQKKKCCGCKIEIKRDDFPGLEWAKKKSTCKACIQAQTRTCLRCNTKKDHTNFSRNEWKKRKCTCKACIQPQMTTCIDSSIEKSRKHSDANIVHSPLKAESTDSELQNAFEAVHSVSPDEGLNKAPKPENLVLSTVEIESTAVLFSMDEERHKRPRDDDYDAEIEHTPKVMKQNMSDEKPDENSISSTSQGLSIGIEPKLVLFRCSKESMWWPALATTSIQKIITATKLDTKQKFQMLKMSRDAPKSISLQGQKLIYMSLFLFQHHPKNQQPMQIISEDEQQDLICDFFDQSFVCENEVGPRGRAVDLATSWGCNNEDNADASLEHNDGVGNKDLQVRSHYEKLKKLEKEKHECEKKAEEVRKNLRIMEQEKNDCKMEAKQQSESIKQLEEERVLLQQKIEKLKGIQDLSEGLKAELECPICLDPFDNPYMNPDCGHRFCYRCIQQAISKSGKECPLCRVKITSKRGLRKDELIGIITNVVFQDDECIKIN